jgi:hypothetical protein
MTRFGDIEPADMITADRTVDPLQVAVRLHEIRQDRERTRGVEVPDWDDLIDRDDRVADVTAVLAWLTRSGAL